VTKPREALPDDPDQLKAMLLAERAESDRLRHIIKELQRHRFGRRAESLPEDQLQLALEEAEQVEAAGHAATEEKIPAERNARAAKRRANRGALPAHLPRIETVVDVASTICPCCSGTLHRIGEDIAERLDIVPAQFRVLVVRRPKYGCRVCQDVMVQAPAPARLIEGGLPTEAAVAHVLVSKFADHLPLLYRQAQIYGRQGVALDRSTLADWVGRAAFLLRPIQERLFDRLKASPKLFADETTAPVLDPGRGRTKTGQLFAYVCGTIGHGEAAIRLAWSTSMHQTARPSGRSPILPAFTACCRSMGMAATRCWHGGMRYSLPSAGAMCVAASTNSPNQVRRRSPPRRWRASPRSIKSRATSAANPPRNAAPPVNRAAGLYSRHSSLGCARSSR
jgi:transposase